VLCLAALFFIFTLHNSGGLKYYEENKNMSLKGHSADSEIETFRHFKFIIQFVARICYCYLVIHDRDFQLKYLHNLSP